jgi:hypothetical protein
MMQQGGFYVPSMGGSSNPQMQMASMQGIPMMSSFAMPTGMMSRTDQSSANPNW